MNSWIFISFALLAGELYFKQNKYWNDPNSELLKKYSNDSLLKKTLDQYEKFKKLQPKEAIESFMKMVAVLADTFKTICNYHTNSPMDKPFNSTPCKLLDFCRSQKGCNEMNIYWNTLHQKSASNEFNILLREFARHFNQDVYLKLAIKIIEHEVDTLNEVIYADSVGTKVGLTMTYITRLEATTGLIRHCIDTEVKDYTDSLEKTANETTFDPKNLHLMPTMDMDYILNMPNAEKRARQTTLNLITLLSARQENNISVFEDVQLIIMVSNFCLIFIFYNFDVIPFALAFACHIVFAMIYVRIFGCLCKVKKYLWTLDLLDKYKQEQNQLQSRNRRARRRRRRRN